ncbi:MAG TPA: hypothetical protein VMD91_04450 [Candidatus Sulfotelmatobacter sp.]|nr:hypothetical protein [Candidatus Sulfotelmatobacter sp.]
MKLTVPCLAFAAAAVFVAVAATDVPAGAARVPDPPTANFAHPIPTATPFYNLASPPATVALATAVEDCLNDAFLSYRSIDTPVQYPVTVCGTITAAPASGTTRPGSFALDVDGTEPIAVDYDGAGSPPFQAGQLVVVRGVYHRAADSGEWINQTRAGAPGLPGYVLIGTTTYQ